MAEEDKNMKKRFMALAVAAGMISATVPVLAEYTFSDIEAEQYSWCEPQIEEMSTAGFINGYEDGTYRPDNEVTKLEGIALFARAMGSTDENNDEIMELAHAQFDSALTASSLAWGEDELAYMMYKGALTAADLITYINGDAKNLPMTRGEAAVIITKAMGGEAAATADSAVSLHYKDAREIPTNLLQYVKFVTDEGIMNGIDDAFCANGTVTRSQIAVMLSRVIDRCDYSFKKARINFVDEENSTINFTVNGEEATEFTYTDDTVFAIKGDLAHAENIPANVAALVQFSGDTPVLFDAMSEHSDEEISAIFAGYNSSSSSMTINVKMTENSQSIKSYVCDVNVPVTYAGSPATIKALKSGDSIILSMSDGKVKAITAVEKTAEIKNAKITDIDIDAEKVKITISSADASYDGKTYPVSASVSVIKNNKVADMTSVYVGDSVSLTLRYGEITQIKATAVNNTVEGIVTGIKIGTESEITLNVSGKEQTYLIPVNCIIEKNGESADVYALRLNDSLKVTVQSGTVISIKSIASNTVASGKVSGTVSAVNPSYKFVSVMTEGSSTPVNVYVDSKTKYTVIRGSSSGASLNSITTGDTVECYVTASNGAYIASDIVIVKGN